MIPSPLWFGGHCHPCRLQADEINWKLIALTAVYGCPSISHSWRHGSSCGTSLSLPEPAGKLSPVCGTGPGPGSGWAAGTWSGGMGFATAAFVGVCGHLRGAGARGPGGGLAGGVAAVPDGEGSRGQEKGCGEWAGGQAAARVSCPVVVPRSRRCPCVLALGSSLEGVRVCRGRRAASFSGAARHPAACPTTRPSVPPSLRAFQLRLFPARAPLHDWETLKPSPGAGVAVFPPGCRHRAAGRCQPGTADGGLCSHLLFSTLFSSSPGRSSPAPNLPALRQERRVPPLRRCAVSPCRGAELPVLPAGCQSC